MDKEEKPVNIDDAYGDLAKRKELMEKKEREMKDKKTNVTEIDSDEDEGPKSSTVDDSDGEETVTEENKTTTTTTSTTTTQKEEIVTEKPKTETEKKEFTARLGSRNRTILVDLGEPEPQSDEPGSNINTPSGKNLLGQSAMKDSFWGLFHGNLICFEN